jgi:thiamine biosynthesis protein ThiC
MRHQWDLAERARVGLGLRMARAHVELDWGGQFKAAINPTRARQIRHRRDVETDILYHVLRAMCDSAGERGDGT